MDIPTSEQHQAPVYYNMREDIISEEISAPSMRQLISLAFMLAA